MLGGASGSCRWGLHSKDSMPVQEEDRTIRVSVVELDGEWRERLAGLLKDHASFTLLDIYRDAKQALAGLAKRRPDILIADVRLSGIDGISVVQLIRERWPEIRVVMFTSIEEEHVLVRAIRSGASGYLLKNTPPALFLAELRVLALGGMPLSPKLTAMALSCLRPDRAREDGSDELSSREKEVLALMALGSDYRGIAAQLCISPHTVRRHMENIYAKLRVHSRSEAIKIFQDRAYGDPRCDNVRKHATWS